MSIQDVAVIDALLESAPLRVLEWGCGGSTLYFGPKAKSWNFVEHDKEWHSAVMKKLLDKYVDGAGFPYVSVLTDNLRKYLYCYRFYKFDLIIVDGMVREDCMRAAERRKALVICHDARRIPYVTAAKRYRWHKKVGDDLLVMSNVVIPKRVIEILEGFDLRPIDEGSNPWDPEHPSKYSPLCGYQHPLSLP